MSRLSGVFQALRADNRCALIPYVVAGDPSVSGTVSLLHQLVEAGADILEIGVPFSDPMAEGPIIQKSHERALSNGMSLRGVLTIVSAFRQDNQKTPVVLMGYANPVERFGYGTFATACSRAGVDGLITVDLPPEEVESIQYALKSAGVDNIFLISPTTPNARVKTITDRASGFIYCIAIKGVTGSSDLDTSSVAKRLSLIRKNSNLPIAVGFGIKDPNSAKIIADVADAVVVGSALIDAMDNIQGAKIGSDTDKIKHAAATSLLKDIRQGVDSFPS